MGGGSGDETLVLDFWGSPYAMRVKVALEEKGVKYVIKDQELGNNKSPLLLQMNPVHKMVPVLIHNGNPISESLVILQYIDETWPHPSPLLPSEPYLRSQARFWGDFIDNKAYGSAKKLWRVKGEEQETVKKEFIESLKFLEEELKDGPFFAGDKFGYIDVALVPIISWFYALEICGNFSIEDHCPKIIAWAQRCQERQSVAKSLPHPQKIYGYVLHLKKLLDLE